MRASEMTATDLARLAAQSGLSLLYLVGGLVLALLGAVVFSTTIQDILGEDAMQSGVEAFHRRESTAARQLRELRSDGHLSASVFLAAYEYENANGDADKLETAVSLFEEALKNEPGRTSAVVGLVSAKLALAETQGVDALKSTAKDMPALLEQAANPSHPDVVYLKAAVDVLDGKVSEAVEVLSEDPSEAPSLEGQGARWWNLAVAKLIAKEDPLPAAARAYNLRRWPVPSAEQRKDDPKVRLSRRADPERLIKLAYRFALCDKGCSPSDEEALAARVEFGRKLIDQVFKGTRDGGRYAPPRNEAAEIYNALGVGLCRVKRYSEAMKPFEQAVRGASNDPLYSMNLAIAGTLALPIVQKEGTAQEFKNTKDTAARAYENVARIIGSDTKRQSTLKLAVDNLTTVDYENDPGKGMAVLRKYRKQYPSEPDWNRHMGALMDWAYKSGCIKHYEKALELGHPDAVGIQERLKLWEAKQKMKRR